MRDYQHTITKADEKAVLTVLQSNSLTRGKFTEKFEEDLCNFTHYRQAVAFSSATAALHAALAYLIEPGEEVIVPAITFAATANAVLYVGGKVKFADVDKKGMMKGDYGWKTVVSVDYSGRLSLQQGLATVSDSAHSMGIDKFETNFRIFSFHPIKTMTTGEGGAIVTNNLEAARWLRQFRSHGITRDGCKPGFYKQEFLGYNYNMTDMQAALGSSQLKQLPGFILKRKRIARFYDNLLGLNNYTENSAWHFYPIQVKASKRDKILQKLLDAGIPANVHYIPIYWHPYYRSLGYKKGLCPNAEKFYRQEISLPIFPAMEAADVKKICGMINKDDLV